MDETEEPDFENLFFIPVHRGNETEVVSPATTKITTTISIDACTIPLPPSTQAYSPPRLIRGSDLPPSAIRPSIRPLLCKKNLSPRSMRDPYRIQYEVHARPDLGSIEEDSDDSYQFDRFGSFSSTTSTMISESSSFGFEGGAGQISPSTTLNSLAEVDEVGNMELGWCRVEHLIALLQCLIADFYLHDKGYDLHRIYAIWSGLGPRF